MNPLLRDPAALLPQHWSPEQALAAFELIELVRDLLWDLYGPDIQLALRLDQQQAVPDHSGSPLHDDSPL
jgi:hypothetical protein